MTRDELIETIEQIYAEALRQIGRFPDQAERIAAAHERNGAAGVRAEMTRIANEQALSIASPILHLAAALQPRH